MTEATTVDGFLDNRLAITQPARGGHRAGFDAVLLAAALGAETRGHVLDLGAGVGVAGLCAAARLAAVSVTLVERDAEAAALARRNIMANGLEGRAGVIEADVLASARQRAAAGLKPDMADHVILNPPYHPGDRVRPSPSPQRQAAHVVDPADIDGWLRAAAALLHPNGTLTVIFRADELPRLLAAVGSRFGSLALLPIHAHAGEVAHRLILRGRPQGRAPLRLLPGLVLHEPGGAWRADVDAVLRGVGLGVDWWGRG